MLKTDKLDTATGQQPWTPAQISLHQLTFGNEASGCDRNDRSALFPPHLPADVTGYSIWRSYSLTLDDPHTGKFVGSWSADSGEFPDQYQLDHMIEVEASANGLDQGYSGWAELDDGRIFVVNYTDDAAPAVRGGDYGITWIRGTYLLPEDLPPGDG